MDRFLPDSRGIVSGYDEVGEAMAAREKESRVEVGQDKRLSARGEKGWAVRPLQ
jgi:hypothetical protein